MKTSAKVTAPVLNPVAQALAATALRALETAEGAANDATLQLFTACAKGAQLSDAMFAEFYPSASPSSRGVYISQFGAAFKASQLIGEAATLQLIGQAAKLSGRVKVNVIAALASVRAGVKEAGGKVTKAQAAKLSQRAIVAAKDNAGAVKVKAKAADARKPRPAAAPASLKGAQAVMGPKSMLAALQVLIGNGRTMKVDGTRQKLWDEGVKGLEVAFESLAMACK